MRQIGRVMIAGAFLVCVLRAQSGPALRVQPVDGLVDAPTTIVASGLPAKQQVTISARALDGHDQAFASQARFTADEHGVVDLSVAKASGSYSGVDAMGLFWSLEPEKRASGDAEQRFALGAAPVRYEFTVLVDNRPVAKAEATRRRSGAGTRVVQVNDRSLVASVTIPAGEGRHPAILHFGGSEGGLPRDPVRSELLASRGYVVMSLAYFNAPGLPPVLENVPLEYFRAALDWLKNQPYVDASRMGVMSASRGSEAALLLACLYPDVRAVVAIAPSSVVWGGFDPNERRATGASAWSYQGHSVSDVTALGGACGRRGLRGPDLFRCALMEYHEAVMRASIPVEKAAAPLLLIAGLDDGVWPSDMMAKQIEDRRQRAHANGNDVVLYLPHAGHTFPVWYGPAALNLRQIGGTREGAAKAFAQAWPALLHFLHVNLGGDE